MHSLVVSFVLLLALVAPAHAVAQAARPERPYRGLFGSGVADAGHLLTASGSLGTGYDDDLFADASGRTSVSGTNDARNGVLGQGAGSLGYSLDGGGRFSIGASAATSARYYPSARQKFVRSSSGSISASVALREGTSISLATSASYQPYGLQNIFPGGLEPRAGDTPVPDLDVAATAQNYLAYDGRLGLSQTLTRRLSLSASYSHRAADSFEGEFLSRSAGAGLSYTLGRGLNLRAGYGYGEARYATGRRVPNHTIDAGLGFNRALSLSRRTTVAFSTGTAAHNVDNRTRFTATGSAQLNHEVGRTWNAWVSYGRQVFLYETWDEPVSSDGVTAGIGGLLSRRLQFSSSVNGSLGTVGLGANAPGFDAYHGNASLTFALARFASVGMTYSYYHHRFAKAVALPPGFPRATDRQSVRATVSVWAPLLQVTRRPNATR